MAAGELQTVSGVSEKKVIQKGSRGIGVLKSYSMRIVLLKWIKRDTAVMYQMII